MFANELSDTQQLINNAHAARGILERFERAKILEIYFSRLHGRVPHKIESEYVELYEVELSEIKNFLLGQHPQDTILQKIFRIMN